MPPLDFDGERSFRDAKRLEDALGPVAVAESLRWRGPRGRLLRRSPRDFGSVQRPSRATTLCYMGLKRSKAPARAEAMTIRLGSPDFLRMFPTIGRCS